MMAETLRPIEVNEKNLALDAIREVGAGGHFFGTAHTIERYHDAFYAPIVSDWSNFETWQENGEKTATRRANALYREILDNYEPPALDPGIREHLQEYIDKRRPQIKSAW